MPGSEDVFVEELTTDEPAVGLVATPENSDQVPAAILRARQHGHPVLVTAQSSECEGVKFASALGAVVITPSENTLPVDDPRERLTSVAKAKGYPGLIYQPDPSLSVDFAASYQGLLEDNRFVIEAREKPVVEKDPHVLVGIPAYNEADTIETVVQAASRYADEVLVVDDGSEDDTADRAEAAGANVVRHEHNYGYGNALKTLFEQADRCGADHLVVLDGDGQHDASDVPDLVTRQQETGAPVVIGSRFGERTETDMPLYRRFGLAVINFLTNVSLGILRPSSRIQDTQSGFRAFDRTAIESLANDDSIGDHMNASTDIIFHANSRGYEIETVSTTIDYAVEDGNSHNPVQHGVILVMNIVRKIERKRPITLLGLPGIGCTLIGFGFAYWTLSNFVQSGTFSIGLALATTIFIIVGILTALTAVVLHSLALYRE